MLGVSTGLESTKRRRLAFQQKRQEKSESESAPGIGGGERRGEEKRGEERGDLKLCHI